MDGFYINLIVNLPIHYTEIDNKKKKKKDEKVKYNFYESLTYCPRIKRDFESASHLN